MPAKNETKEYVAGGYYHIYNRGVEKRIIFLDEQDYAVFLSYLKTYLLPKDERKLREQLTSKDLSPKQRDQLLKQLRMNNFYESMKLIAYCLMPNHFHLFIQQTEATAIDQFMNSLATRYVMYFNRKYDRVGPLFQGIYKAVRVVTESQFLHLSRYIHRQALDLQGHPLREKYPNSYPEYVGKRATEWIRPDEIVSFFSDKYPSLSYEAFVKQEDEFDILKGLTLEK